MSAFQITAFEADKYYVMSPPGEQWGDYEGPFDTKDDALAYLRQFINGDMNFSPEMLRMVVVYFDGKQTDLVRSGHGVKGEPGGTILNGNYLYWRVGDE